MTCFNACCLIAAVFRNYRESSIVSNRSGCLSLVYTGSMRTAKESNPESTGEVVTYHSTPPVDSAEDETRGSKV